MSTVDHDVIVVGAGPNGLLAAGELTLAGVRPLVLDKLPAPNPTPKANGLVGRVSEALDRRGLFTALGGVDRPRPIPHFQFGALDLDMSGLTGNALYALPVPQLRMEQVLAERAAELGVPVRRGHEVVGLEQDADRVTLHLSTPDGELSLTARYVVAADGGRSAVRKLCGIGFPGITETDFVGRTGRVAIDPPVAVPGTGELDVPGLGRLRSGTFRRTERGLFAYGMFQPGLYSVAAFEYGGSGDPKADDWTRDDIELPELAAAVERVLGAPVPLGAPPTGAFAQASTVSNSRQAERYRHGRVLLAGDAAHVHSGMGGPGLNLGMTDVVNLGWKLAAAVRGWAPADLLDSYHRERHPVGERVLMHSRAQTALIGPGPHITALRELMDELLANPANVQHVSDLMSGADTRYDMGSTEDHDLTGRWLPDLPLDTAAGPTRVAEVARSGRPLLLDLGGGRAKVAAAWEDRVDVLVAATPEAPAGGVLVRPDGHVAWAGDDPDALEGALRRWFGEPT
ncbi:FAD-dependent monooxygenase [Pseudonocardia lacus]|uniref:FAD-dependent monooxygenase n=1 Tax=Pseudonocardia lacus TaxID=2835865 RepID=UPI001BDD9EA9|nr:FAD-dependent monooxygenase [Pseudonocardia lacus]